MLPNTTDSLNNWLLLYDHTSHGHRARVRSGLISSEEAQYLRVNAMQLMQRPYGRIMVLHVSIIGGGFLVTMSGNPFWMLPFLITVKTIIDLRMHLSERRIFGTAKETT